MIRLMGATFYKEKDTKQKLIRFIKNASKLSFGKQCIAFEKMFARWQGRKDAIFFNSGSSANLALIQALLNLGRLKRGDKVAFSALTWSTNVMPLIILGLVPVPMDVMFETFNVSSKHIEKAILRSKVKAVFITNLLGFSHDLTRVRSICKKHNVILLEDNCESLGSVEGGTKLGNFGLASTFSFFVGHHLSTIEGGMVATSDKELAEELRIVRAHGWDRHLSAQAQHRLRTRNDIDPFYGLYTFYDLGYNLRPSEINGFLGQVQLRHIKEIIERRKKTFHLFAKALHGRLDAYAPLHADHMDTLSAFSLPILCVSSEYRNKLIAACKDKIEIRPIVGGSMTLQPFFKKYFPGSRKKYPCPNAERVHELGLYLPIHPEMTTRDKKTILQTLSSI